MTINSKGAEDAGAEPATSTIYPGGSQCGPNVCDALPTQDN